jgi:DNA-binding transcriptional MerR regulator
MRRVADLQDDGVNLAGVGKVLDLERENAALRQEIADSAAQAETAQTEDRQADDTQAVKKERS